MSALDQDFVRVRDGQIVDGTGTPLLLRGMGLGNWLLAEGYMWRLSPGRESAREIESLVVELVGPDRADRFWCDFRDRFVTRADIERMAADGFDHVRLPINWRIVMHDDGEFRSDGFDRIDDLIGWCRSSNMRVLLDLHGAPGGQTGTNIDDSSGRPELFMDDRNVQLTEQIWTTMARRYRDEPTVLGYDLLNEPLPNEWQYRYADELVSLYRRLTEAIREVDDRHLIMYEGSHWATNWSIFDEVWDANSVLQFHKYWSPPDRPSIEQFIEVGERLGLPIYMGEGGENNTDWLATAFQMYEDLGIGWCFWPWKKIDTRTSPCSIVAPEGWDSIVDHANDVGPAPHPDDAWRTLQRLNDAVELDRCTYHADVVNALFRRAPVSLPATAFGFGGAGVSYSGGVTHRAPIGFRDDDGVAIDLGVAGRLPEFDHTDGRPDDDLIVRLDEDQWVAYSVDVVAGRVTVIVETTEGTAVPVVTIDGLAAEVERSEQGRHRFEAGSVRSGRHDVRVVGGVGGSLIHRVTVASS